MAIVYSVTLTQITDLAAIPVPDAENYTLESTFSSPEMDAAPATGAFSDGAFILLSVEATEPDDVYQKICTYADVIQYSNVRATAVSNGDPYYRVLTRTLSFQSATELSDAATLQQTRTQYLCDDFAAYDDGPYPDTTVTVVTSA